MAEKIFTDEMHPVLRIGTSTNGFDIFTAETVTGLPPVEGLFTKVVGGVLMMHGSVTATKRLLKLLTGSITATGAVARQLYAFVAGSGVVHRLAHLGRLLGRR
jgi:hypothetical protein